jgi:hypothetical protein
MTTLLKMVSGLSSHEAYGKNTYFSGFWHRNGPVKKLISRFIHLGVKGETNTAGMKKQ